MLVFQATRKFEDKQSSCYVHVHVHGIFRSIDLLNVYCSQIMNYLCQKCKKKKKKIATDFISEVKRVENYPGFEKNMAHVIQQSLQEFIAKNALSQRRHIFRSRPVV